jgi:hypothetical protein
MAQDDDTHAAPRPIHSHGNGIKYFLVAVVSVLATLGLVSLGFLLYRLMESRQAIAPSNTQVNRGDSNSVNPSISEASTGSVGIQAGQFVQPAFGNKARVELLTAKRIPGRPDEVNVDMRIERLTDDVVGSDVIIVGSTTARNPITSETYQAVDFLKRSSGSVSLYSMRQGQPVEGYAVLKVPQGVNEIDIFVENTRAFKNVPITDANQTVGGANNSPVSSSTAPVASTPAQAPAPQVPQTTAQAPQAPSGSTGIQPGQFVQSAFGTKGEVELLSVKRIQDPDTKTRNVVNVQMRIRRLKPDRVYGSDSIFVGGTTARNPETSETYKAASFDRSTGSVSLFSMRTGSSADAYIWLRVPEEVNTLDIFVPDTAAFKNVPIAN